MFSEYSESGPQLLGDSTHALNATFRLTNTNVTMANTLRRAILTLTPSVGFRTEPYEKSDVIITTNTTPLVNEMIAHRVGMIPIKANPAEFNPAQFEFVLDKENNTKELMDVRASDFKVYRKNLENPREEPVEVPNVNFFPPDPITGETILITRLRPQWNPSAPFERIQLKARASISNGAENIRYSPVSQSSYEYTRDDDEEHLKAVFEAWLDSAKKIKDPSTLSEERRGELEREFNTMEIQRCYKKDARGDPNDFTFHVESIGVQPIPDIVRNGINACIELVSKYIDIDGTIPENVRIQQGDSRYASVDVIFQNEAHTLGNLLETVLVDRHIDGPGDPKITYAGYKVPHPLRAEMFVRIGMTEAVTDPVIQKNTAASVIANACRYLKEEFRALQNQWSTVMGVTSEAAPSGAAPSEAAPGEAAPAQARSSNDGGVYEFKEGH
jgi:DNA-directed RNA polymerase subunit L